MAIRSVLQKMLDQGGNGISPEEFEEVKSFTSTFPDSKGILQKMLDQGGNGISPEEFDKIKTWSSPGMIAAKSQVQQEAQAAEDANGVLPKLGGAAKDAGLMLGQGVESVVGQLGTLVAQNPLEAMGKTAAKTAGIPAIEHLDLLTPWGAIKVPREIGKKILPESVQNALLLNPDNWLTQGARDVSQIAQEAKTQQQQEAERTAQESAKNAKTIGGKIYESTIGNPQALAATAIQSAPQLLVGGAVAKGLQGAGVAAKVAERAAALTGSAMQASDTWQDTYFSLLEHSDEIAKTPEYQKLVASGLSHDVALRKVARSQADDAMTMSGLASAATTFIPFANSIEGAFARGAGQASRSTMKNIAKAVGTFAAESGQEFGEEYSAAVAKNLASNPITGVDPLEGALQQGATGAMLGGIMSVPTAAGSFQAQPAKGGSTAQQASTTPVDQSPVPPAQSPLAQAAENVVAPTSIPEAQAPAAPAIPETQPDLASRAMAAKQRGVEEDFAEWSARGPEFAQKVAEWRDANPSGEADQFETWLATQPRAQAEAAVQSAPEVVQAQADASQAAQKVEAAQQVLNSDPTQAPPPGLTAEEARDVQQNGTESLEKEAKAAEEQARTVAQTKAKEIEQNSPDTEKVKAATEAVKQSRKTRKAQAKEAFTSKLKAMSEGAMEWDEETVRTHAEDAGISPEAVEAKLASARKRLDKMKVAEAKKAGKDATTPAPTESKVEEAKAEFTPPTQGAEGSRIDSAPSSDLETQFAEEIAQEHIKKGFKKANELYIKRVKANPELRSLEWPSLLAKIKEITDAEGVPFEKEWKPYNERKKIPDGLRAENLSNEEIAHFVYSEYKNKGAAKGNALYRKFFGKMNPESKADYESQVKRRSAVSSIVKSLLERNGIPIEKGWVPPKKGATESVAQAEPVTEAPVEESGIPFKRDYVPSSQQETPNEDGIMPIVQPEDGTVLSDIQDSKLEGVPKSMDGVGVLEAVPEGSTPAEIVGVIHAPGQHDGDVVFRHKDGYVKLPQSNFKAMAQGDTGWSIDPEGILVAEREDGTVMASEPMEADAKDSDNIARLERQPLQADHADAFIRSVTPDAVMEAADRIGVSPQEANDAAESWAEALNDILAADSFTQEMGTIANSGADLSMAQLNALAERAANASKKVQETFAKMLPALEILATAEALDLMENSPAPRLDRADIAIAKGWGFYHELEQIAESSLPRWAGSSARAADYLAWKFQEHTGKPVTDATADEIRVWAQNQVRLNANNLPAWMWAAMGGAGALAAGGIFGGPGAFQAIATGLLAIKAIQLLNYVWGKMRSVNSPRAQIMQAASTAKHSSADIISMLDQAFLRAMEIKGPAKDKMRALKKKYFRFSGKEKFPELGRAISNLIEGKARLSVPGMTDAQVDEAVSNVRSILEYFRRLMVARGMPTLENYLPRMTHADGFAEMMADPVASQTVLDDTADKVERTMPDAVTDKVHEMNMKAWTPGTNASRRRAAAIEIARDILKNRANESEMEKFGVARKEYTRLAAPSPTKARSLPFDLMEEVKDSAGKILPLIERDAFKIMDRYIPSMSRAIAQRETVNKHRINQWLDGLQLPPGWKLPGRENVEKYRARILSYVQNDLDQSLSRMLTAGNLSAAARALRIANTVSYLALSPWYPMLNLAFGVPLAFGLTGMRGGSSYLARTFEALRPEKLGGGKSRKEAELLGAITDGIFHDIGAGEGSRVSRAVDLVNTPASYTQEAVDVGGFYAGRAVAPRLLERAKKGHLHSKKILGDALGEEGARDAMARGVLTDEEVNRIGLFFKTKISGTARSLNLPAFMGSDLGRTLFQFGSIPMEQTKTLVEDILGSGKTFGASRNTATFAAGAGVAGLASLVKLAGMSALSTGVMGNPESDRRKWMRKQSPFELLLWAAVQGGSFQLMTPLFESVVDGPKVRDYKKTILDLLPMPTVNRVSLPIEMGRSMARFPSGNVPYIALPVIRDLVNNQTSMFRGIGVKIPNQTRLEKRIEKKD